LANAPTSALVRAEVRGANMTTPSTDWAKRWQEVEGEHWVSEASRYDTMVEAFGNAMLDAANLKPGERVLDVGCGNGATTVEAARRIQPGGSTVGIDLSEPMLGFARQRAAAVGVTEIQFMRDDAEQHPFAPGEFDIVLSRFGVMFFNNPQAAFANIGRALRRGGRLAFVAWQGMDRSQWIMVVAVAAAPHVGLPEGVAPDAPGPAGLANPERVRRILDGAGFMNVTIDELVRPMRIGNDVDDAISFIQSMPVVRDMLLAAPPDKRNAAVDAARESLRPFASDAGVVMNDNAAWLVTAHR
jgi:SAM-dependent methyltransferase